MKQSSNRIFTVFLIFVFISCNSEKEISAQSPNIIFILADDLGWKDVGFNGIKFYETPNLNELAKQEVRQTPNFWYFPVYLNGNSEYAFRNTPGAAIRKGEYKLDWKFSESNAELYNLKADIGENKNLARHEPEIYTNLFDELKHWLASTNAKICTEKNIQYDSTYTNKNYDRIVY